MDQKPEDSSNPPSEQQPQSAAPPPVQSTAATASEASGASESGLSKDSLNMGMLCHLLAFCGLFAPLVGNILGPLILWMMKKDEDSYVDQQGKESVNFQISVSIYSVACILLIFTIILAPVAGILLTIIGLAALVLTIIGTIKASKGEPWRYPLTIRLIK